MPQPHQNGDYEDHLPQLLPWERQMQDYGFTIPSPSTDSYQALIYELLRRIELARYLMLEDTINYEHLRVVMQSIIYLSSRVIDKLNDLLDSDDASTLYDNDD
jgi:hypothetical protein